MIGRVKTYEAIVKGENIPQPGVPESFKVLIKELQSLALDIKVMSDDMGVIEVRETDEDETRSLDVVIDSLGEGDDALDLDDDATDLDIDDFDMYDLPGLDDDMLDDDL